MGYVLRDYQVQASDAAVRFFNNTKSERNGILVLPTGCHAKGSMVLMKSGEQKKVEDVKVGDLLMGDDGTARIVLELHHGFDEMYRICPIQGDPFVVNGGHILHLRYKSYPSHKIQYDEISVREYETKSNYYKRHHRLHRARFGKFSEKKDHLATGFSVEYVGKGEYYGFTLDGNHLYLDSQYFVHHNSGKSLIIADIASRLQ